MEPLTIYHAHPVTGEFIGAGFADPDPLNPGNWLIPAHAYSEAPPEAGDSEAAVRQGNGWVILPDHRGSVYYSEDGEKRTLDEIGVVLLMPGDNQAVQQTDSGYELVSDYRGLVYWTTNGERHEITELGIEPPADALDSEPEPPKPTLDDLRAAKLAEINAAYTAAVTPLVKSYPEIERLSWAQQQDEAAAYQAWADNGSLGESPVTPVLDRILAGRNGADGTETVEELVGKVLDNAQQFIAAQQLTGKRHRLEKAITGAQSVGEVESVAW